MQEREAHTPAVHRSNERRPTTGAEMRIQQFARLTACFAANPSHIELQRKELGSGQLHGMQHRAAGTVSCLMKQVVPTCNSFEQFGHETTTCLCCMLVS